MHPILIKLGGLTIYTYGFFLALAFSITIVFSRHRAQKAGEDPEQVMDLFFYIIVSGIIGARLFYVATTPKVFLADPIEIFKIWNGGLVFFGGFIGAMLTSLVYMKKKKMNAWKILDIAGPTLALGHSVARLGCFFAGCCYGKECHLPWAVTFNNQHSLAPIGIALHPTQIYSSINLFIIFCLLMVISRYKKFDGQLFWIYILLYGLTRSIVETLRGDPRGNFVFDIFSIAQTIGLVMSFTAIFMLVFLSKREIPAKEKDA